MSESSRSESKGPFADLVRQRLVESRAAKPSEIVGLSPKQLEAVELGQRVTLRGRYREFLTVAGKEAGWLFRGSLAFYPDLLEMKADALDLLGPDPTSIATVAVEEPIMLMHQGYTLLFLRGEGDDPGVYQISEGDDSPSVVSPTFSEFLLAAIESAGRHRLRSGA